MCSKGGSAETHGGVWMNEEMGGYETGQLEYGQLLSQQLMVQTQTRKPPTHVLNTHRHGLTLFVFSTFSSCPLASLIY